MSLYNMTIDGGETTAASWFDVVNPGTGEIFAQAPQCTQDQLDDAMASASRAFVSWSVSDDSARRAALQGIANALIAAQLELAELVTKEQGKPLMAAVFEVTETARWFSYFAELPLQPETLQDDARGQAVLVRRPLGVVAAITPWNFPLLLLGMKLAPALLAGNTIVLKPSPFTPLSTLAAGRIITGHLPPGVLNVVSGGDALGAWMTGHPTVRKISFTGSVATGKAVAAAASPDLKRITLELGGNDAAIVLDDADPSRVAAGIFWGAFTNNGQICAGIKRVYVPDRLHDAVVEALAERARRARVGNGMDDGVQLGPINNKPQFERVSSLVADALADGALAAAGGHAMDRPGYFFEPTILHGAREGMRIVDEEQFGPALPVLRYSDLDEAIVRANATPYGLSGSVWSSDEERAARVAARLDCGSAYVNTHLVVQPHLPFGGWKWSGIGIENGPWGLDAFCSLQVRYCPRGRS
ncbi:aldehyde dehydrogenase family protein [Paraburkholderia aspalathi]|uniref:Acyl-CoA reductase n=1 Tax=Paraburkholderia aspalathi TaxID=1324617 RepID=A0A1I7DB94_9BURK|nr:aldehyde dehydrogenase family protein [Paraburkholderia aspalathi]SFU08884.1 Acyl-CoA reductase [Paraburkholderia aspalathi]